MRALVVHPGTQYSARLARQLERHAALASFHTCFAFSDRGRLADSVARLPMRWQARLANRRVPAVPQGRIHLQPWLEFRALAAIRMGWNEQDVYARRNAEFQRSIPDRAILESSAVIGFDTSSWIIGARARHLGRAFLLDQSIGHPESFARVAARLAAEFPDWSESIPRKSKDELAREAEEHALATRVVVPSRFVARTLKEHGVDAAKIVINPFGVDLDIFRPGAVSPPVRPLRFVFAGSARPRKGLPLLLDVWRRLPGNHGAELWVVGEGAIPDAVRALLPAGVRFLGRLSQAEMAQVFAKCHVFVFPSFFEGLAQVQIEAAACGLPVIGTESSGCEEIVRDGETGYVLPTGDGEALYAALKGFVDEPEKVLAMRERLLAQRLRWSWDAYGERWMEILRSLP
jgi:glycosyltransferase involved in cell wall biosynthesis